MHFSIRRDTFLEGIQKTLSIVDRRTTLPILNNILLKTQEGTIRVVATDREVGLSSYYEATIHDPGEITVSSRKLYEMLREIDGETVDCHLMENHWMHVTCGKILFKIPGIPAEDFPEVPDEETVESVCVPCELLKNLFEKTFFAISQDEMRPNLNGVLFSMSEGKIAVVATDGHRLSLANAEVENNAGNDSGLEGIIIPRKGVSEIRKLVEGGGESALWATDGVCVLKKGETVLRVSLINAEYPDYKRVIPQEGGVTVHMDKQQILHSLRRMSVMSTEKFSGVKVDMFDNRIVLTSTNPDVGEAKDEIDVTYTGDRMTVGYSVRYLIEGIEPVDGEIVSFEMRSGDGPGVIRAPGSDQYMCIVMPIKLRTENPRPEGREKGQD